MYIGVPAIINRQGIREVLELELNEKETEQFNHSVEVLQQTMRSALN
ncbi:hypothetical protein ACEF17_13050 [Streptococcus hyovaginalis]